MNLLFYSIGIAIALGGIALFDRRRVRREARAYAKFVEFRKNLDAEHAKIKQRFEDERIDWHIEREALEWFGHWVSSKPIAWGGETKRICIWHPRFTLYHLHDESTARYRGVDLFPLIREKFEAMKAEYERETKTA